MENARIRQLERQRRSVLARGSTGNQRDAERTRQRSQDISFQIAQVREDAAVRRSRAQEDADRQRNRTIEDAVKRREQFDARSSSEGLLPKLGDSLANSISSAISSALAGALAGLIAGALENPFKSLIGGLGSLFGDFFGGGEGGDGDGDTSGTTDLDGTLTIPKENIKLPEEALDLKGAVSLALADITAPTEAIDLTGRITTIEELSESVKLPPVPGLTGGIGRLVLPPGVDKPIVPGLTGEIAQIQLAEGLTLPALHVPIIYDVPDLPEGWVEIGELEPSQPTGGDTSPCSYIRRIYRGGHQRFTPQRLHRTCPNRWRGQCRSAFVFRDD